MVIFELPVANMPPPFPEPEAVFPVIVAEPKVISEFSVENMPPPSLEVSLPLMVALPISSIDSLFMRIPPPFDVFEPVILALLSMLILPRSLKMPPPQPIDSHWSSVRFPRVMLE